MRKLFAFLSLCLTLPAIAGERAQEHATILGAIRRHIESNFRQPADNHEIEIAPLSPRLQLPECAQPLEVFRQPGSRDLGHLSMGVRCRGQPEWTIYHRAYVRMYRQVAVLNRAVKQGELLGADAVDLEKRDLAQLRGGYLTPEQIIGKPARRTLPAGTVLNPDHLAAIKLIRRNQQVAIQARNPGFEIRMNGVALMDGQPGQRIRVRNEESKRIVEGLVVGEGVVSVLE
jgi:flagella basal body P-ring formation protein FlgA